MPPTSDRPTSDPRVLLNQVTPHPPAKPSTRDPLTLHQRLPGYERTPLRVVPALADRLGIGALYVKDESVRLGLPAFKMLGASWASYRSIIRHTGIDPNGWDAIEDLAEIIQSHLPLTLATATDGNHGRAVARIARLLGLDAKVWVPIDMVKARIDAIYAEGATVTVVDGSYDDAVKVAAAAADDRTLVVSDTSWSGYETVPQWVIDGYSTLMFEIEDQEAELALPMATVVSAPMGVGALAVAMIAKFAEAKPRPVFIGGEPSDAACVLTAVESGEVVSIPGKHDTMMAGLNCGTVSPIAFPVLRDGLDAVVAFDDEWAEEAMRLLAAEGIVAGETGAASLATLLCLVDRRPDLRNQLNLGPNDTALVVVTEGATDPVNYDRIVGRSPASVEN
ncbi:MAG: diaminopropionate ammonia-lyase [Acidimicrobiia bacterium]|nr:diaminopropionate ammonia-lyase [Acidimicrobiia bacterium]